VTGTRADIHRISLPTPFPIGPVNVYLLEGRPLTLVDSGPRTEEALAALEAGLADHGRRVEDLELILLTHEHLDHSGMAAALAKRSGAEVAAEEKAIPYMRALHDEGRRLRRFVDEFMASNGAPAADPSALRPGLFERLGEPIESGRELRDGELIEAGGRLLRVHSRPGHSRFDLLFHDEDGELAFGGDHLLAGIRTTVLSMPAGTGQAEPFPALASYRTSLRKTRSLELSELLTGHGDVVRDHRGAVDWRLGLIRERTEQLLRLLEGRDLTAYEAAGLLRRYGARPPEFPAVADARSHLDLLVADGVVQRRDRGGTTSFSSTPGGGSDGV
jgi:glyoxylase-like metal-dependent hydrolase (beta-lactamase superfamily II)